MHDPMFLIGLASIVVLGIMAQWLAWRLGVPAILLLLLFGFAAGPGTEVLAGYGWLSGRFLRPDELFGEMLLPLVSVSVAIILFEGGLTLNLAELSQAGRVITNLVSSGALVTWMVATGAAWGILGLDLKLSLLLGAILVVTGPTVIGPLLRSVRPQGQVGAVLKWEGIVIDPIGAMLAVVVYTAIPQQGLEDVATAVLWSVTKTLVVGGLIGWAAALALILVLRRYWVPDFLQNPVTLMLVVAGFAGANLIQSESGLFSVTIMGIILANQKHVSVRHILEFKENLAVLLVSSLFILLGSRLELQQLDHLDWHALAFLAALVLVGRPLAVLISTARSGLNRRERVFLMCMAPRGIVAAAVSSVFALNLRSNNVEGAEYLVPYTFAVIVGTVTIYGLLAGWAARRLKLADPGRLGFLIAGANPLARALAKVIQEQEHAVLLVDTSRENLLAARLDGLPVTYGSILSQFVLDRTELSNIGRLLALTPNEEVNSLAALQFGRVFGRSEVFQLGASTGDSERAEKVSQQLRGRPLFAKGITYARLEEMMDRGAQVRKTLLTKDFDFRQYTVVNAGQVLPLLLIDEAGRITLFTAEQPPTPRAGQTIVGLKMGEDVAEKD